jgi:hypothetical protein
MKKYWRVVAIVTVCMTLGITLGAGQAAAQGPAGAGAGAGTTTTTTTTDSSHSSRSYNPIKWVRKSPKTTVEQLDANSEQDKRLTEKLQAQGLLPAKTNVKDACATFKELGDCIAALHVSHNLGLDFNCLKADLTGVLLSSEMSSCKGAGGDKALSLSKTIHLLKPDADAKSEAKNAEKQAKDDLKNAGA